MRPDVPRASVPLSMKAPTLAADFVGLDLSPALCRELTRQGITEPTPIQAGAIPVALRGRDLIGIAQTGTGKTLAFVLPMVDTLPRDEVGLVLAPTRELAQQIHETYRKLDVRSTLVVGGASMNVQITHLRSRPRIIVATPGRLIDHLNQGTVKLDRVSMVVLDEADRMLDMGFTPAIRRILESVPAKRQTLMFSATMPPAIAELANQFMRNPDRVEVAPAGTAPDRIEQELIVLPYEEKGDMLNHLLNENRGTVLVFARTRHGARKLAKRIRDDGHTAAEIHADRTLAQRREAIDGFKSGRHRVLVATDIAARGIDVKEISLVINYDLPDQAEDYLHRIGRTGRAGHQGVAISLALPDQRGLVRDIERVMGRDLDVSPRSQADFQANGGKAAARKPAFGGRTFGRPTHPHKPAGKFGGKPGAKSGPKGHRRGPREG